MKKIRYVLYLVLMVNFTALSQKADLRFTHITNEDGLSNSTVEVILQDHKGFLWLGTADGLNKYDGYQFTVYKNIPSDSTSITDNYINHLYEDKQGRFWVSTANGLNLYDHTRDLFKAFLHDPDQKHSLNSNYISVVHQDAQGQIWVGTSAGLARFNESTQTFSHYHFRNKNRTVPLDKQISCLHSDQKGNLWIGSSGAGVYVRKPDHTIKHFHTTSDKNSISSDNITAIMSDHNGNIWVGTEGGGVNVKHAGEESFLNFKHHDSDKRSISGNVVKCIGTDRLGNVWIGTENGGLNLWNEDNRSFTHYENDVTNPFSLSQKTVSSFYEDRQGNIWIGTHRGGLNRYSPHMERFQLFKQGAANSGLSYKDVKTFFEDEEGIIWIGTDGGGITIWDMQKNTFSYHSYDPDNPHSIGSDAVLHIMADSDGDIWIGTWGGGLNLFDKSSGTFKRFKQHPDDQFSISSNYVWKIFEDSQKNLWVATSYGGLNRFDKKTGRFIRVGQNNGQSSHLIGMNIHSLAEDRNGLLWIGSDDGGLSCFDWRKQHFRHYFLHFQHNVRGPSYSYSVGALFVDSKGKLWVGHKGLHLYNETRKSFEPAKCQYNLNDETVQSIEEDAKGNLWISTTNGLIRYNSEKQTYKKFTTADGLQGLEFGPNTSLKTRDGKLMFGGNNGFNVFDPENILTNTTVPPVYLTDFQLSNASVRPAATESPLKHHISHTKEIILNHKQTAFSIEYAALNYIATDKNQYAYKLAGFDKDWHYVDNIRKATYTNLNPGTYTFRVKASNNDGLWNEEGTSVDIIIKPPFWKTWWFRSLAVLALIAAFLIYLRLYKKLETEKINERKKEEMHQMQLQFFTNISHEFRTPLSLIMGAVETLRDKQTQHGTDKYLRVMEKNTNRLTSLISELMDFRKLESGMLKLHVKETDTLDILRNITEDFYTIAEQRGIDFSIQLIEAKSVVWIDTNVIEKIALNLLNNAFKYTNDGCKITVLLLDSLSSYQPRGELISTVKTKYEGLDYLYLVFSDTGIGIPKDAGLHLFERYYRITDAHMGSGIGLAFVKSLTFLHKGFIQIHSAPGEGTDVLVGIPCNRYDYTKKELLGEDTCLELTHIEPETSVTPNKRLSLKTEITQTPDTVDDVNTKRVILLVDDNEELRTFLKEGLESDYRIVEAEDGLAAYESVHERTIPDLIISDLMMPHLDGVGFCKLIKENPNLSHIPFLMLTAKDALESRLEGAEYGADHYFTKPISLRLLRLTISNIFTQNQKLKLRYLKTYQAEIKEHIHAVRDQEFIDNVLGLIEKQLESPDLNVEYLCHQMGMSQTKFYKKIKELTGKNINEFIRTTRLKKAAHLLSYETYTVNQVMYMVGISSASYFTAAFKKEFGVTPSHYVKEANIIAS